jgi:glutamine synthetase adenylyltransferase
MIKETVWLSESVFCVPKLRQRLTTAVFGCKPPLDSSKAEWFATRHTEQYTDRKKSLKNQREYRLTRSLRCELQELETVQKLNKLTRCFTSLWEQSHFRGAEL